MMLFPLGLPSAAEKIYSVSELCRDIKTALEERFSQGVWVEGEISNLRRPSSGHMYFSLKDSDALVNAVLFRGRAMGMRFEPSDGMKVLAFGTVTIYEGRGVYQIIVERLEPKGLGALQAAFEQLKAKLLAEGLFDPGRKKPVPMLPQRLAIVTSPTGAAIRDILHVLDRRFSNLEIAIYPVPVQGEEAAGAIAQALCDLNGMGGFDVILVTRGGGSFEDLWPFNEEVLARAIADSQIPVISAVGHEIDYTISDMVADLRCPTPSAAAELVIARKEDLQGRLEMLEGSLRASLENLVLSLKNRLQLALRSHGLFAPGRLMEGAMQRVDDAVSAMAQCLAHARELAGKDLERMAGKLEALSPLAVLGRGYSITFSSSSGRAVRRAQDVSVGEEIKSVIGKGRVFSNVSRVEGE